MKRDGKTNLAPGTSLPPPQTAVPPLRGDLAWEEVPGDPPAWRLLDARMGRTLKLDTRGREIALLLDRAQSPAALLARIAEGGRPIAADALDRVLATFAGFGLLDDEDARAAGQTRDARLGQEAARELPLRIAPELRFECTACGSCCIGVNVGPVTPDIERGLDGEIREELVRVTGETKGFVYSIRPDDEAGDAGDIRICRARNGGCVFLEADGKCAIHRRWGPQRKPRICRLFPYQFVMTPGGVAVGLQLECRDILAASRGAPLADRSDELRAALELVDHLPEARMLLSLDDRTTLPFERYAALEDDVCRAIEAAGGGGYRSARIAWDLVAARVADLGRVLPGPDLDDEALRRELWTFVRDLGEALHSVRQKCRTRSRRVRFHDEPVGLMLEALSDAPLHAEKVLEDDTGEAARFARLAFVNQWRGKDVLGPPDLVRAVSQGGLRWFLTRALAQARARQVRRFDASPQDVVDAFVMVQMLLRNSRVTPAVARFDARITLLFGRHLARLVEGRARMRVADDRTDFFLV